MKQKPDGIKDTLDLLVSDFKVILDQEKAANRLVIEKPLTHLIQYVARLQMKYKEPSSRIAEEESLNKAIRTIRETYAFIQFFLNDPNTDFGYVTPESAYTLSPKEKVLFIQNDNNSWVCEYGEIVEVRQAHGFKPKEVLVELDVISKDESKEKKGRKVLKINGENCHLWSFLKPIKVNILPREQ